MLNLNRKLSRIRNRDGISIIEVLTSMAVATIGVFGVMVMIPFAVRQSQLGLDNDAANAVGRNAIEQVQIQDFLAGEVNLMTGVFEMPRLTNVRLAPTPVDLSPSMFPSVLHFDPIGVAAGLDDETFGTVTVDRATGLKGTVMLTDAEAAALCRNDDDLQFVDADSEDAVNAIGPPQPILNDDGSRQSLGRLSWSVFLIPEKAVGVVSDDIDVHRMRTHTLVYEGRFPEEYVDYTPAAPPLEEFGEIYDLDATMTGFQNPVSQILVDGVVSEDLNKDQWVMLINTLPGRMAPYDAQIMFARVTRVNPDTGVVTVDGGPFNFGPIATPIETKMIHLRDVVNVFERSIAIED